MNILSDIISVTNRISLNVVATTFFVSGIALAVVYFYRKATHPQTLKVLAIKSTKKSVIVMLLENMTKLANLNEILLKQNRELESFNNQTIEESIELVEYVRSFYRDLCVLSDVSLKERLEHYFDGKLNLLTELYNLENDTLQFQKDYQQRVIYYNREFEKLSTMRIEEPSLLEYKRQIRDELETIRIQVTAALQNVSKKRKEFMAELENSQELLSKLLVEAYSYKHRYVDTKRFYLKYLSFL